MLSTVALQHSTKVFFFFFFNVCVHMDAFSNVTFFFIDEYSDSDSDWDHLDLLQLTRVTMVKLLQELQQSTSTVLQRYFFYCLNRILVTLIAVFFCVVLKCRMREQIFFFFFSTKDENTATAIFFSSLSKSLCSFPHLKVLGQHELWYWN